MPESKVEFRLVMLQSGQTRDMRYVGVANLPLNYRLAFGEDALSFEFASIAADAEEAIRAAGQKVLVIDES